MNRGIIERLERSFWGGQTSNVDEKIKAFLLQRIEHLEKQIDFMKTELLAHD